MRKCAYIRYILAVCAVVGVALLFFPGVVFADSLGDQHPFFVNEKYDRDDRTTISATLRAVGRHAYFYVDDAFWNLLSQSQKNYYTVALQDLSSEFDDRIYPIETGFWGSERVPGIDGDVHVTVLLENLNSGNGGYFDSVNGYPRKLASDSNEREMVAIGIQALGSNYDKMFLGHEFQHLISFNQKEVPYGVSEEIWLNELRSEHTSTLLGYNTPFMDSNLGRRLVTFLSDSSDSLTEWPNVSGDYAIAAVFAEYLTGRYGGLMLSDTLKSPLVGISSINDWLARNGFNERFDSIFLDWMVASWRNDSSERFGYASDDLRSFHISPSYGMTVRPDTDYISQFAIKPWQPVWYVFGIPDLIARSGDALRLDVTGQADQQYAVAYAVVWDDGTMQFQRGELNRGAATSFVLLDDSTDNTQAQKRVRSILVAVSDTSKQSGFTASEPASLFTLKASVAARRGALDIARSSRAAIFGQVQALSDSALIKRDNGEPEMYVIRGIYRRYLRPNIISMYGHLDPAQAISLNDTAFSRFTTSNYVRGVNGEKVYAVWPDGTKHWLHMTGEYFAQSGRDWNSVFIINDAELNAYKTGSDVTQ